MRSYRDRFAGAALLLNLVAAGCTEGETGAPGPEPIIVTVAKPVHEKVQDYEYFNGRTAAKESVEVRARVGGYLSKIFFKEGDEVKKGAKLFEIDRRPYEADVAKAAADVERAKASAKAANYEMARQEDLLQKRATSKAEFDKAVGDAGVATATVRATEAALDQAKLNLDYTIISAEIDGKISNFNVTEGNLIVPNSTLLTTIVSVDPIYAYFDVDENTVQHIKEMIRKGLHKSIDDDKNPPLEMGLSSEVGFPHHGFLNFVDNRVNPGTGTLRCRGTFPNPNENGARALAPGFFCRIRFGLGRPHEAVLVSERAVGTDQGQKYVLIVDDEKTVKYVPVRIGSLWRGLRVIEEGLKGDENVIVNGLQRVRAGVTVNPQPGAMIVEPNRMERKAPPPAPKI